MVKNKCFFFFLFYLSPHGSVGLYGLIIDTDRQSKRAKLIQYKANGTVKKYKVILVHIICRSSVWGWTYENNRTGADEAKTDWATGSSPDSPHYFLYIFCSRCTVLVCSRILYISSSHRLVANGDRKNKKNSGHRTD